MSKDTPVWPPHPPRPGKDGARRTAPGPRARPSSPVRNQEHPAAHHLASPGSPERATQELRLFGLNACLAAFAARPQDLRKAYFNTARMPQMRALMAWCVHNRIGYRVVEDQDLMRLAGSQHHEGVCLDMRRPTVPSLEQLLARIEPGTRSCLLWLDGVGNPHNLGAVLRSAAHFGVQAVLLPPDSSLSLSGAACRVAEGGAEAVPLLHLPDAKAALARLKAASFSLAATVPHDGQSLFDRALPERTVLLLGAEREGMQADLIKRCDLRLNIPGTGRVESLNIASAVAVLLAWMFHGTR